MRDIARSAWVLLAGAIAACTTEPGCDICTTSAVVYGTVTTDLGSPIHGARVHVEAFPNTCGGAFVAGGSTVPVLTAADGSYRDRPSAIVAPFHACLRVIVTPPPASGLSPRTVDGAEVEFLSDYRGRDRDSVRVDVSLSL